MNKHYFLIERIGRTVKQLQTQATCHKRQVKMQLDTRAGVLMNRILTMQVTQKFQVFQFTKIIELLFSARNFHNSNILMLCSFYNFDFVEEIRVRYV